MVLIRGVGVGGGSRSCSCRSGCHYRREDVRGVEEEEEEEEEEWAWMLHYVYV